MERLIVSLASLSFVTLLLFEGKKDQPVRVFIPLCIAVFLNKASLILARLFPGSPWEIAWAVGILALSPLLVSLTLSFVRGKTFLSRREVLIFTGISLFLLLPFLGSFFPRTVLSLLCMGSLGLAAIVSMAAVFLFVRGDAPRTERHKMGYVLAAAVVTFFLTAVDAVPRETPDFLHLSDLAQAILLYLLYLSLRHPKLPVLNEAILRVLYSFGLMVFVMAVYYGINFLAGGSSRLPAPAVFALAWLVVVFMNPVRGILRGIFRRFFPAAKKIFQSFRMEDIERERSILLEEMATGLAHEIRNPLGSIKGAAEYLRLEEADGENRKLLGVIVEETDRLNTVVSQFLNYARPFSGNLEKKDLNEVVDKVVSLLKTMHLPRGTVIRMELDPGIPPVRVDGEQMIQVLLNLGLNAVEAMPRGGVLTFSTGKSRNGKKESVEVVVRDTGEGISKEALANIFKPFFTTKKKGTGLGLSICERIVRNHGGEISVESEPGAGTAFRIRL
jgi:signal transduction histidine kinase